MLPTKKNLLLVVVTAMLVIIALANCADQGIPVNGAEDPPGYIICGELSKTWHGGLCAKHGTCNKPCSAEGFDVGYCATFPYLTYCCCTKNCNAAASVSRPFLINPLHKSSIQCG